MNVNKTLKLLVQTKQLLVLSTFNFCHNVFKSRLLHIRKKKFVSVKGLSSVFKLSNYYSLVRVFHMSRSARKPTLWTLSNISTQISLRIPRRLIRADSFRLWGIEIKSNDS